MDRFIKKNLFLVGVLGISAFGVLVLLILSFVQYFAMSSSMKNIEDLRERNRKLMRQSIPAIAGNIDLVQINTEGYKHVVDDFKKHFGHPLYPALEAFAAKLDLTPEQLQKNFADYWESVKESAISSRAQICRNYRSTLGKVREGDPALWKQASWDEAMEDFIAEARKSTIEEISEQNYEEIFLSALGLPRNMNDSESGLEVYKRNMQNLVVDLLSKGDVSMLGVYFTQREVDPIRNNQDFDDRVDWRKDNISSSSDQERSRSSNRSSSSMSASSIDNRNSDDEKEITAADEIRHWEIIADLAKRMVEAKIDSLEELSYKDLAGREENGCHYYTYTLSVVGSEQQVRTLLNLLNAAYDDHRVYVVRNISIIKKEDQVQDIIDMARGILSNHTEESAQLMTDGQSDRGDMPKSSRGSNNQNKLGPSYFVEEGKYPECVAGRSNVVEALLIVDYVVYSANTLK